MIDWPTVWSYIIPGILAAAVGIYAFLDARVAPSHKRTVRLSGAIMCYYFVFLYLYAIMGGAGYYFRAGWITRAGVVLLLIVLAWDIKASKRDKHAS